MSVDFRYCLITKPNSFLPEARQVTSFLKQAEVDEWLRPQYPGWIARKVEGRKTQRQTIKLENALSLVTECWNSGIRMGWRLWRRDDDIPFDLEIHVSPPDYVYSASEAVARFGETVNCSRCGTRLDHDATSYMFGTARIYAKCPQCDTFFDPSHLPAIYTHGWTGDKSVLPGGTTYRFALIVNNVPPEQWEAFQVDPDFVGLAKRVFGCDFYGVVDVT
jgi:hypothetical protein